MSGGAGLNDNYLDVMEQYEGETLEVRRGRGAWIFERSDGVKLLKEYRGSVKRLEFEETVLKGLKAHGIGSVDQYVRNRQGELVTSGEDGTKYVLKDWFVNRECNLKDSREILTAVTWIARLHQALREIAWQGEWDLASMHSPGLSEEMQRHTREMKRVRTFVSNKRKKSQFELCVMQNFSEFYEQALEAQQGLGILEKDLEEGRFFLCHGDLNQHHLLIGNGDVAVIEFNQMHRGNQMADLYHFMRKVMEKHGWDECLGQAMTDAYHRVLPMDSRDRECLYYLFLYPEKYWKQLNYYFNANKAWTPAKNVEKLQSLKEQQEARGRFLERLKE